MKVILTNELEKIKNQDIIFKEQNGVQVICPDQQKRVHDLIYYMVLIVSTQFRSQFESDDIMKMKNQLVNNYR